MIELWFVAVVAATMVFFVLIASASDNKVKQITDLKKQQNIYIGQIKSLNEREEHLSFENQKIRSKLSDKRTLINQLREEIETLLSRIEDRDNYLKDFDSILEEKDEYIRKLKSDITEIQAQSMIYDQALEEIQKICGTLENNDV